MKISIEQARDILKNSSLTDEQIQEIINSFYYLAEKLFDNK